ncbi:hypothetical protein [Mucilaginibacter conchicola]|nr:hypothetical protein [Mucilaginibacter conchicola]
MQLAELGLSSPAVIDELRTQILNGPQLFNIRTNEYATDLDIMFDSTLHNGYQILSIEASVPVAGKQNEQMFQLLEPDVPAIVASELMHLTILTMPDRDPNYPMNLPEVKHHINNLKSNIMNTQNLEFLNKTLLNLGFGEKLNTLLEKNISENKPEFALLTSQTYDQKDVAYALHFKAGSENEMYFLNKFDAAVNEKPDEKQTFYINKGNGITAKEAFNLMEDRAVYKQLFNKEGEKYHAWLKLDGENLTEGGNKKFKQWNDNYGYDPEQLLKGKGIKEMDGGQSQGNLMRSLKKGNAAQITAQVDGSEKKFFITANPQFKTVDLYDQQMKRIKREELLTPTAKKATEQKQTQQQNEALPAKKQRGRKVSA